MDNGIRGFVENRIPYLLHSFASGLDVVIEGVILTSDIHHEGCDESATPDMAIDPLRKVLILEFFGTIGHFGFLFDNESLDQMLDTTIYIIMSTYFTI